MLIYYTYEMFHINKMPLKILYLHIYYKYNFIYFSMTEEW